MKEEFYLVSSFRYFISNGNPEQARQIMEELRQKLRLPETETPEFEMLIVLMALVSELSDEIGKLKGGNPNG